MSTLPRPLIQSLEMLAATAEALELQARTITQLRLITLAAPHWRSEP